MELNDFKLKFLSEKIQVVIFDQKGKIIDSCDTLIQLDRKKTLFDSYIALEAFRDEVMQIDGSDVLQYPCLNNSFGELGFHDFYFELLEGKEKKYLWTIHDLTDQYSKMIGMQQDRNDTFIQKERLQVQNMELKIKSQTSEEGSKNVFIKNNSLLHNLDTADIYYAEAFGDYVKLHTESKTFLIYSTLKKVEQKLPAGDFIKVHRSFIVKIDKIANIHTNNLEIKDRIIPISILNRANLMKRINII